MFNFLDPKLLPKVDCSTNCTDNYEVSNLISNQFDKKIRGFIAYPSVKPPIELEFQFICNVNMYFIVVNTSVGNLRCSGIEIFSKSNNTAYVSIAKAMYDKDGVVFCNSRRYTTDTPPPLYTPNYHLGFFKSNAFRSFLNATSIKIVIFKTEKSVPCLGSVQVWGQTSKLCTPKTVETVRKLMNLNKSQKEGNASVTNSNEYVIPEDFKDDLTYEIMTIPYTLPSGKTVDQTTLEKHNQVELSFGRKPCDPFTGINFTDKLKPILNVPLKSRIDMFLLQNSHRPETFGLKRSLRSNLSATNSKRIKPTEDDPYSASSDQLDLLITKAKNNPNFISFTEEQTVDKVCCSCSKIVENIYKLPCTHYYCRPCLLEICKDCICVKCKKHFVRSAVEKCKS
ncbi:RING finger protein 37 [Rhynchophorus ferrugineus]|uniref:U-box domain-containing protein n=1 Tax=Rhynchophorus ferrugineus TaxID=354439 RepID=A0A834IPL8_RHYFE|nr:hypothetical protein GWI33_023353 [Rhynchophorus ferrugineus]